MNNYPQKGPASIGQIMAEQKMTVRALSEIQPRRPIVPMECKDESEAPILPWHVSLESGINGFCRWAGFHLVRTLYPPPRPFVLNPQTCRHCGFRSGGEKERCVECGVVFHDCTHVEWDVELRKCLSCGITLEHLYYKGMPYLNSDRIK